MEKIIDFGVSTNQRAVPGILMMQQPNIIVREISILDNGVKIAHFEYYVCVRKGEKVCHVSMVRVSDAYQGQGLARQLYELFCERWHTDSEINGLKISRFFANKKAEHLARRMIVEGKLPAWTWDPNHVIVGKLL